MVWTLVVPLVQDLLQYVVCVDLDVVVVVGEEKKRRGMDTSGKVPISPGRDGDGEGEGDGGSWAYVGGKRDIHTYSLDGWMDGWKSVDRAGTTKSASDFLAARDTRKTDTTVKKALIGRYRASIVD